MGVYQGMSSLARITGPFWAEVAYGKIGIEWPYRTGSVFMLLAAIVTGVTLLKAFARQKPRTTVG